MEVERYDPNTKTRKMEIVEKTRNAYLLIYERTRFLPPESSVPSPNTPFGGLITNATPHRKLGVAVAAVLFVARLKTRILKIKKVELSFIQTAPLRLRLEVWEDNQQFSLQKFLFNPLYHDFFLSILSQIPTQSVTGNLIQKKKVLVNFSKIKQLSFH